MRLSCHRCGAELPGESVRGFCAACGAPQLIMSEMASSTGEVDLAEGLGSGAPPPPRPGAIRWATALRCGAMVAVGAGLTFALGSAVPALSLLSVLLIFGAAGLSLTLYRRSAPESLMNGSVGARIGLTTGLMMMAALTLVLAGVGVVARFRLHAMAAFDAQWATQMQILVERTAQAGQGAGGQVEVARVIQLPEFRAWSTLGSVVLLGVLLLGVTTGSGALVGSLGRAVRARAE